MTSFGQCFIGIKKNVDQTPYFLVQLKTFVFQNSETGCLLLFQYVEFSICIFQRVLGRTTVASTVSTVNLIAWTVSVTATEIRGSITTDKILQLITITLNQRNLYIKCVLLLPLRKVQRLKLAETKGYVDRYALSLSFSPKNQRYGTWVKL